jgi:serine protease AprX
MTANRGFTWTWTWTWTWTRVQSVVSVGLVALLVSLTFGVAAAGTTKAVVSVIVRDAPNAAGAAERAVEAIGGAVTQRLAIINGLAATVPVRSIATLTRTPGVQSVTPNGSVHLQGQVDGYDPNWSTPTGSWKRNIEAIKAKDVWKAGFLGQGIDVALLDSGVAPVEGINDHLINGPDLSFESQADNLRNLDTYGHGTHMAGIIAGRDSRIKAGA